MPDHDIFFGKSGEKLYQKDMRAKDDDFKDLDEDDDSSKDNDENNE